MRPIRVASAALLGLGALALCAPVILASDTGGSGRDGGRAGDTSFGFRITPTTVTAGGRVSLHLDRGSGCRGAATVTSGLFDTVRIPSGRNSGTATVDRTAKSQSSYRVTFNCDGSSASTELAIASSTPAGQDDVHAAGHSDGTGDGNGRTDEETGGRTAEHAAGGTDSGTDTDTHTGSGSGTGGRADDVVEGLADTAGSGSHQALNPQPLPPGRGVQAGEGGSIGGFDLGEIGFGVALVVMSIGTAYRRSRRHAGEEEGA
ncbi:hypothetical protein [Streptomyces sp. Ag109_O5-10]|uniref:hypothetical protein n=1 Tax=Streptomyces sp. Ag109_O5-10 TaxID=1855349 RepID=UPI000897DEB2|nr:hypothetical protein [Streptomyces sp. Ag109_O5-10]SEF15734.1 hypothetical protein SAMN05216533_7500 [Streptomyces sp. Ag109_O5-10]